MKSRLFSVLAVCLFVAACSPSIEEIETILNAYIAELGEEGPTSVLEVEQTDKNIYSGTYSVSKETNVLYAYPFTAIVKKNQVSNFFKDTDEANVLVITVKPEVLAKGDGSDFSAEDLVFETKKDYEERIRREEEERQAAIRRASGEGLGPIGADYLLSHQKNVIQIISYRKVNLDLNKAMFGQNAVTYSYKVLEANGLGTNTATYGVVFVNGKVVFVDTFGTSGVLDDMMDGLSSTANLFNLLGQ